MKAGEWKCDRDGCGAGFRDIVPEYEFGADGASPMLVSCANGHGVGINDVRGRAPNFAARPEFDDWTPLKPKPAAWRRWLFQAACMVARAWPWGWRHILRPVWNVATPQGRKMARLWRELEASLRQSSAQMERVRTRLGRAGRIATPDELRRWTGGELLAAEGWAQMVIEKRQGVPIQDPPIPAHVAGLASGGAA